MTMMTRYLLLLTLTISIQSSFAFLSHPNFGRLSHVTTKSSTQHFFKSPLVQEALEQCVVDRNVDPDQMIDLLKNLLKVHDLRPNQSFDWYGDLQGSFELVFSSSIAEIPLVGKNVFHGYFVPMREIVHFDFPNHTMGMEVKFLPLPNFPTFTLWGHNLEWNPEEAQVTYQMDGKDNTSVWKILYADGHVLVAECSVHLGLVVLRRIPPSELEALREERGQHTDA